MRRAVKRDLAQVVDIYSRYPRELGNESPEWLSAILDSRSRRVVFLVAEHNNRVVGFAIAYKRSRSAYIESLAVDSEFKGVGVGSKLLLELENTLARRGVQRVYLSVKNWNFPALNFYLSKGYSICGVVLVMCAKPESILATENPDSYEVSEVPAGAIRVHRCKPLTWWSSLVDDVDHYIYRKFYREERALVVRRSGRVKAVATYTLNHNLVVDSILFRSYNSFEVLTTLLYYLKNVASTSKAGLIEIPVDASKKKIVEFLEKAGFRVCDAEYLLFKELIERCVQPDQHRFHSNRSRVACHQE